MRPRVWRSSSSARSRSYAAWDSWCVSMVDRAYLRPHAAPSVIRSLAWRAMSVAHRVAVIGGDGIGPEVTAEALKVVAATGVAIDAVEFDLGGERYLRDGEILSDTTLDELRTFDAILLGAVGTPAVPPGVIERGLLLKMRFELDLYINQRPFTAPGP